MEDSSLSVVLSGYGGLEKIQVQRLPFNRNPEDSQAVVKVRSCGLNFADIYTRQGLVRNEPGPPFVMGLECSGVVVGVGSKVENLKEGDRVVVHTGKPGLQTEFLCVESSSCFVVPESMSFDEAAAFPVNYLTAYFCLFDIGNLRSNQTVLIPSAAGGVGWAATQLAKSIPNVRVVGLASPSKHEAIRANGVDVTIDSRDPCWDAAVKAACPQGVDIALDCTSGDNFRRTQLLVKDLGRAILIGANDMIAGETLSFWRIICSWWYSATIKPVDLVLNSRVVAGFHLTHVKTRLPERYREALLHLFELYEKNVIRPQIDSVWTFSQITEATNRLSQRKNIGKVILTP
ncbi:Synaptic vesicle membrane protein VAT-1 [Daphnia magna]|uniref:Synaptic vesicle membrane protein VAT-1 n=1 Tax=Daphnia magna TaxID=35525 RepID=A0A0P5EE92_9CRUS|nr:Synaptic vesicle membrane protein VAT-1 [Daphnia magna]